MALLKDRLQFLRSAAQVDAFIDGNPSGAVLFKAGACDRTPEAFARLQPLLEAERALPVAILRVVEARAASDYVEARTGRRHQSPQLFLFREGAVALCLSHSEISAESLQAALAEKEAVSEGDMSNNVQEFTEQNWETEVMGSKEPVVVDFWAPWCAPCRQLAPTIEAMAGDYAGRAKIGKLNVDDHSGIAARYGIRSIPTVLILKEGKVVEQRIGLASRAELGRIVDDQLRSGAPA